MAAEKALNTLQEETRKLRPAGPMPSEMPRNAAILVLVAGACAMGLSPVFVRAAEVGPLTSAFWRVALALPLLYGWMRVSERRAREPAVTFPPPVILAGILFACDLIFWHLAIVKTNIANATFFATTAPVWVVIAGFFIYRAKVAANVLVGLGLCLCGGAALIGQTLESAPGHFLGDVSANVTALFFGLYFLAVQAARRGGTSAARTTFELSVIAAALLLIVALVAEHSLWPRTLGGAAALVAMAWISHAGGQGALSIALGRLPAVFSALVIFLEAIFAAGFAWLFVGEPVGIVQAAGGIVILAGIWHARPRDGDEQAAVASS